MKLKLHLAIAAVIAFSFTANAQTSDKEAAAREWITSHARDLKLKPTDAFTLSFVYKGLAGDVLRFQQMMNDVPVFHSEIVVNFNPSNELVYTDNSYDAAIENISTVPAISKEAALSASKESLKFTCEYTVAENNLFVTRVNDQTKLVYRVVTNPISGNGSWVVLVDAQNGAVLSTHDEAVYYHEKATADKSETPTPMAPLAFTTGTAMVYLTNPLSPNHATYGQTGYVDGGTQANPTDANTTNLANARTSVTLPEIDLTAGVYRLKSSFVDISDFESPTTGVFTQATNAFNFTRDNNAFEAVNAFYHLDLSLRYINQTLGVNCRPALNSGVLRFDSSGLSGADNSHYIPSSDSLAFGEGCVDDAEDSDVIMHEFGHGIHDWMTNGNTSPYIGEGNGDYWAQSFFRSYNQLQPNEAPYNWMFKWDGHNFCWDGRTTDYAGVYPGDLVGLQGGAAHTDGQIWATGLMQIWDVLGKEKTDKAFLLGLALTTSSSNQQTSAIAFRQAAVNLNYSCAEIAQISGIFATQGYTLAPLPLSMAAIANQSVNADASNTYTLPSYATLANPIAADCNSITLTQDPATGTVLVPGVYTITMQATSGTSVARTFQLTVNPFLGVAENTKNNFVLYPNPATNVLNVKGDFDANESVVVYNMLGQAVLKKAISTNDESIDISSLSEGVYNVYFNTAKASYKFVKK